MGFRFYRIEGLSEEGCEAVARGGFPITKVVGNGMAYVGREGLTQEEVNKYGKAIRLPG